MEFEVGAEVLEVVIVRELVCDLSTQGHGRLVGPASGHVADGVAASAQEHEGQVVLLHEPHALGVALEGQIEAAQSVSGKGVSAALEDNSRGLVALHDLGHDGDKDVLVALVVDAVSEGEVDGVVLAFACADILQTTNGHK